MIILPGLRKMPWSSTRPAGGSSPAKCSVEEEWMRLRSCSSVLRVSRRRASTLRWLKCDSSSLASASMAAFRSFFLRFLTGGEGPELVVMVSLNRSLPSARPSSPPDVSHQKAPSYQTQCRMCHFPLNTPFLTPISAHILPQEFCNLHCIFNSISLVSSSQYVMLKFVSYLYFIYYCFLHYNSQDGSYRQTAHPVSLSLSQFYRYVKKLIMQDIIIIIL